MAVSSFGSLIHLRNDKTEVIDTEFLDALILGGHGGRDYELMKSFVAAAATNDPTKILSDPEETLETYSLPFCICILLSVSPLP